MKFYDREAELEVLRNAYEKSLKSATFTVLSSVVINFISPDSPIKICNP